MTTQNYLMISTITNIVNNICVWDGDVNTWTSPSDSIQLMQTTTPAMVWIGTTVENLPSTIPPTYTTTYNLEEVVGAGDIGFTWDGTVLTTNQPKP